MPTAYDFQFYPPKLHKILEEETKLWKEGLEAKSAHDKAVEQAAVRFCFLFLFFFAIYLCF